MRKSVQKSTWITIIYSLISFYLIEFKLVWEKIQMLKHF